MRDSICVSVCLCVFPPPPTPERTDYKKNCQEVGTSVSVDQKRSGRSLTSYSYNRKTRVHKQYLRGCSDRSGSRPAFHDWKTI